MASARRWIAALGVAAALTAWAGAAGAQEIVGFATIRGPNVVQIANWWVSLLGVSMVEDDTVCRRGAAEAACGLIALGKFADLVGGKYYVCDTQQFEGDVRTWATCTEYDREQRTPILGATTLNRQLVQSGWAMASAQRGEELAADAAAAKAAGKGLWAYALPEPKAMPERLFGPADAADGNTLTIGGVAVHLWGADAPELAQTCRIAAGTYSCGAMSQAHLIELTMGKRIACDVHPVPGDDRVWGVCAEADAQGKRKAGAPTLNDAMVRSGWAVADRRRVEEMIPIEIEANNNHRGMWGGQFTAPALWRRGMR